MTLGFRTIPDHIVIPFLLEGEDEVLRVYDDARPKKILKEGDPVVGVLTAGVGHTGPDVVIGMRVTQALSRAWLKSDLLNKAAKPLYRKIGDVVHDLTEHQYAALLSFVFNLGTGNPAKREWAIWGLLRKRKFDQIHQQFAKFVYWNGKKSTGLVNRRAAEQVLWATNEPGTDSLTPPSSVTRREETPPLAADPVPAHKDAGVLAAGGTAALGFISTVTTQAPETIRQGMDVIRPFAGENSFADILLQNMSVICMVLALVAFGLALLNKRKARS